MQAIKKSSYKIQAHKAKINEAKKFKKARVYTSMTSLFLTSTLILARKVL